MEYTISNQETADKPGPGFYNRGTLSGFEEDINEDVNVKDSRKIKLTPTTKNQILTLVHEIIGEALKPEELETAKRTGETLNIPDSDTQSQQQARSARVTFSTYK